MKVSLIAVIQLKNLNIQGNFKLHHCGELTQGQYDDIDDYLDDVEDLAEKNGIDYDKLSIECGSNNIMITLISLILFFL